MVVNFVIPQHFSGDIKIKDEIISILKGSLTSVTILLEHVSCSDLVAMLKSKMAAKFVLFAPIKFAIIWS